MKTFAKIPYSLSIEVRRFRLLFSAAMLCIVGILALTAQSPAKAGYWEYVGSTPLSYEITNVWYGGSGSSIILWNPTYTYQW